MKNFHTSRILKYGALSIMLSGLAGCVYVPPPGPPPGPPPAAVYGGPYAYYDYPPYYYPPYYAGPTAEFSFGYHGGGGGHHYWR